MPSFQNALTLLTGWVFAPRRTVTGMIAAAGAVGLKHHSAFHRLFASARWSRDKLGLIVFEMIVPWLGDDTLARKRGLIMFGVGVIVRFPLWPDRAFCLPILFRLYLNKKSAAKHRRVYRSRPELMVEMLQLLCQALKNRRFHLVADSAYGGQSVLHHLPSNCDLTSRSVMNARLYALPPERVPG